MSTEQGPVGTKPIVITLTPAVAIPEHLTGEIKAKLAYVDEHILSARVNSDRIELEVSSLMGDEIPSEPGMQKTGDWQERLVEKVQRVVVSMAKGAIKSKVQVLEDHLQIPVPYQLDPMEELFKRGEISQEATGIYALGPLLSHLVAYFEQHFLGLAESFGAAPYRFPTLIPAHYLERVSYFRSFPHSLTFVTHLREDLEVIDQFAQEATCQEQHQMDSPAGTATPVINTSLDSFAKIQALLSPAVCYHLYFTLADKPLPGGQMVATAVGNCFRYEAINLISLERLWNFTMREVIFVGSKDFVLANRETARQRMAQVMKKFGLAYRVESANDPFFIGEFRKQVAFQSAFQLKYEIRAWLPYKDSTLAVGSYNYHQDFFGRNLNITLPDGSPAHTGCVAFGLERMAFAFLAQYGFDQESWPVDVRNWMHRNNALPV